MRKLYSSTFDFHRWRLPLQCWCAPCQVMMQAAGWMILLQNRTNSVLPLLSVSYHLFRSFYYMARQSWGKSERCDWFFLGRDFAIRTVSIDAVISRVFFFFESRQIQNLWLKRVPYNKLLAYPACSSYTGEYWSSVVFVRSSLRYVRTATTSGQKSPVRLSPSVSKKLILDVRRPSVRILKWYFMHVRIFIELLAH